MGGFLSVTILLVVKRGPPGMREGWALDGHQLLLNLGIVRGWRHEKHSELLIIEPVTDLIL